MAIIGEVGRVLLALALLAAGIGLVALQAPFSVQETLRKIVRALSEFAADVYDCLAYVVERRHRRAVAQRTDEVIQTVTSAQVHIDTVMGAAARQMRGYVQNDRPTTWQQW